MQSYLKRTIFFVLILAIFQVSFEANTEFTVEKLDTSSYACKKSTAEYDFDILGTWSGTPDISSIRSMSIQMEKNILLIVFLLHLLHPSYHAMYRLVILLIMLISFYQQKPQLLINILSKTGKKLLVQIQV